MHKEGFAPFEVYPFAQELHVEPEYPAWQDEQSEAEVQLMHLAGH